MTVAGSGRQKDHLHVRRGVIVARVSSREQAEGYSIDAQLDLLRGYGIKNDIEIVREFAHAESAKDGGKTYFAEIVSYFRANPDTKILLVEKTDRLYRNFRDFVTIDDLDLEIHLVKEGEIISKDSKSHQKFIHGIKLLMAKNYIDNLSEEVKKGMAKKAEKGTWPGYAPIGYMNVSVGDKRKIVKDPGRATIIPKLFECYASGTHSLESVRAEAEKAGLRGRRGHTLSKSQIASILKNPFYTGDFVWKGQLYNGDHEPLISRELFDRVQARFLRNCHSVPQTRRKIAYIGLIKCAKCGCAVTGELKKGKYVYYHCTGARGGCDKPRITEVELEKKLGKLVAAIRIDEEVAEWIKEALLESHRDEKEYHNGCIASLNRRYEQIQTRLDKMYLDKVDGKIDEDFWLRMSKEWRDEQQKIRSAILEHERANTSYFDQGVKIIELAQRAYSLWLKQNPHEKAKLLRILLSNCTFDGVTLYPTYRKPFCWLAEGLDRSNWQGWQDLNRCVAGSANKKRGTRRCPSPP